MLIVYHNLGTEMKYTKSLNYKIYVFNQNVNVTN